MWNDQIILLFTHHRQPSNQTMPLPLTKYQIVSLLGSSLPPNQSQDNLTAEVQDTLNELQALGEIIAGTRNRYCMAPPTVLAKNQEELTGLLFRGDRAYLTLAHQALETQPNRENLLLLRPKKYRFHWIKDRLSQVGIRLLTASDSIEHLPKPRKPLKSELRLSWSEDPFSIKNWSNGGYIQRYLSCDAPQKDRWHNSSCESIQKEEILRLPTGEYLWFEEQFFYELEPDVAILAMFYQDVEKGCSLKIHWDEPSGRLNLQGVILPGAYARWLWHLSEPDPERYRTRYFQPANRHLVEAAFNRLGCILV
jgi:hypothetical protein